MDSFTTSPPADAIAGRRSADAENRWAALTTLFAAIEDGAESPALVPKTSGNSHELQLAHARLGVASSLFSALRAKHPPTAAHCLRVALGISSWALASELPEAERDHLEVAALLHDVGKIGVPDHVLLKPGKLSGEEFLLMERHRQLGLEILSGCCSSSSVLDIVHYSAAWYDGSKHGFDRSRDELPLGARMIGIVDAFDAMTTDHLYRRALSRERAVAELFEYAGTQFDPQLVRQFCEYISTDKLQFTASVSQRWLGQIQGQSSNGFWGLEQTVSSGPSAPSLAALPYYERLLDSMHDGVVFLDQNMLISIWNRAAERLTGISANSIVGNSWLPSLVHMRDERGALIADEDCPLAQAMSSGAQAFRRLDVMGRTKERVSVDFHITPVLREDGVARGAAVILHDASSQITLEERVQSLNERATTDPLTKLANRAEFDHGLHHFAKAHLERGERCSMIICDIDHFKSINDTFGHQAGDEALIMFSATLQAHARSGDLVARYGGEEFVILCADCDNATATRRAESMRRAISEQVQPSLGGKCITASFGVTEIQGGDTAESFLNRADRALLQAKSNGRNLVVQLGTGLVEPEPAPKSHGWFGWLHARPGEQVLSRKLITVVPLSVAAEKLRGYAADHQAQVVEVQDNRLTLKVDEQNPTLARRWSDRPVPFLIDLVFDELTGEARPGSPLSRTLIQVAIRPRRQRDRRRRDTSERARQLLASLKAYLMAHDFIESPVVESEVPSPENQLSKTSHMLSHWFST